MLRTTFFGLVAGLFLGLAGAVTAEIGFQGGDGTSAASAIVISGAGGTSDGIAAEYRWIQANRPGAEVLGQALMQHGDRFYDVITIRSGSGTEEVFFDITDFFGKF